MSHPDPHGAPDLTPIQLEEGWENPVTGERATIIELPETNPEGRATAELTALVGARVVGEHHHPALIERFTVLEGELTLKLDAQTSVLREGETGVIEPGVWHDWWNASSERDARARVEVTPGERFAHMIETMFGLARLGHTNAKRWPYPSQSSERLLASQPALLARREAERRHRHRPRGNAPLGRLLPRFARGSLCRARCASDEESKSGTSRRPALESPQVW